MNSPSPSQSLKKNHHMFYTVSVRLKTQRNNPKKHVYISLQNKKDRINKGEYLSKNAPPQHLKTGNI